MQTTFNETYPLQTRNVIGKTFGMVRYHIVIVPRWRRKVFKLDGMTEFFTDCVKRCGEELGFNTLQIKYGCDYVSIVVTTHPDLSAKTIARKIKESADVQMRSNFTELRQAQHIWTRHYFATTESLDTDVENKTDERIKLAEEYANRQPIHG